MVRAHAATLFAEAAVRSASGFGYPKHVEDEFTSYLDCGVLSRGFLRVHCEGCGKDELCAFSCKGKAFCPSCIGRRMSDTSTRLVGESLPDVAYRQWVFSFPKRLRVELARDSTFLAAVLSLCIKKVLSLQKKRARKLGFSGGQGLAALFVQRFSSLLTLNPHGHSVVPDGVFVEAADDALEFLELPEPSDADVQEVGLAIVKGIFQLIERRESEAADLNDDELALANDYAEAANGDGGKKSIELAPQGKKRQCALIETELGMFSIHAATSVGAGDRAGLERLLRYCARPPFAQNRLSLSPSGKVVYKLKRPYFTGQTEVVLEPVAFLRRLAALVPPKGQNQVRYYGLLASQAKDRGKLAALCHPEPEPLGVEMAAPEQTSTQTNLALIEPLPEVPATKAYRKSWAVLLKRVFQVDVLVCPHCQGDRRIIGGITGRETITRILNHIGEPTLDTTMAPARAPPQLEMWEDQTFDSGEFPD